jgi:DNA-binding CsgD family transcriptional regulator
MDTLTIPETLTDETVNLINKMHQEGKTQVEIAIHFGISVNYVHRAINGVRESPVPTDDADADDEETRRHRARVHESRDREITRLYVEDHKTYLEIAKLHGMTKQNVQRIVADNVDLKALRQQRRIATNMKKLEAQQARARPIIEAREEAIRQLSAEWIANIPVKDLAEKHPVTDKNGTHPMSVDAMYIKIIRLRKQFPDLFPYRHQYAGTQDA